MRIERPSYLQALIDRKDNGLVKVITGIRRAGKSYLLNSIYGDWLIANGVKADHVISIALDKAYNAKYRNPLVLDAFIREIAARDSERFYVFLDEIQKVAEIPNPHLNDPNEKIGFVDVVLGLMDLRNADIYVTGSNSKMLSSGIMTEFRDRGDEVRLSPLTFKEFHDAYRGEESMAWAEYYTYGGLPLVMSKPSHQSKSQYLKDLFRKTYLKDVIERNKIQNDTEVLNDLLNVVSSSVGSLTNPSKLANTFSTVKRVAISPNTIGRYLGFLEEAFILDEAKRYDIKGRRYIETPLKYFYADVGLRNARLEFRQLEEDHLMENIVFNELKFRGFDVDVGVVEHNYTDKADGKNKRAQLEIDFVANKASARFYIQVALGLDSDAKREQETRSLRKVPDAFKKIVIVKDRIIPHYDESGICLIGINDFLLDPDSL